MSEAMKLEIVLPAHNERKSIGPTLQDIHAAITSRMPSRIVICEDGSTDGTPDEIRRLAAQLPIVLHSSAARKGYSRAVKLGLLSTEADWVLCLDSDGQCDPEDFWKLWQRRGDAPVIVGWRRPRRDPPVRLLLSRVFYLNFKALFRVALHDPSSPMVLMKREVLLDIVPSMGRMDQGFWWEFSALCHLRGIPAIEIPVRHRLRSAGETQIYRFRKMPGIFTRHLRALVALRFEAK